MALTKVSSKTLSDNAVTADKIATGAITITDIPDGEITAAKLHTTAVTDKLGYTPVAPGDSPSFAGLTVDTDTLHINATNNRVGIGTTTPSRELHVVAGNDNLVRIQGGVSNAKGIEMYDGSTVQAQIYSVSSDLRFFANNTERMRIDSSGNVGIGTSSPDTELQVIGDITVGIADNTSKRLIFQGSGNTGYSGGISWQRAAAIDNSITVDDTESLSINFAQSDLSGRSLLFKSGSAQAELMRIDSSGNVGIGTSSPAHNLQLGNLSSVSTSTPKTISLGGTYSNTAGSNTKLRVWTDGNEVIGLGVSGNQFDYVTSNPNFSHVWYTNNTERMRIDGSGRVTMPYQPVFVATNNAGTHTTNTSSTLDFNVEKFDKGNNYNPSTYRFTAPIAGAYYFNFHVFEQTGANAKSIVYKVNGSNFGFQDTALGYQGVVDIGQSTIDCPIIINLAANDYVEVAVRNVAAANLTWYGGHSWFMGYLIG